MIYAWYTNANLILIWNVKIQNVLKPLFVTFGDIVLIEHHGNQELEQKEKQEKDCRHYWEMMILWKNLLYLYYLRKGIQLFS